MGGLARLGSNHRLNAQNEQTKSEVIWVVGVFFQLHCFSRAGLGGWWGPDWETSHLNVLSQKHDQFKPCMADNEDAQSQE
jgi:hypothetical protein